MSIAERIAPLLSESEVYRDKNGVGIISSDYKKLHKAVEVDGVVRHATNSEGKPIHKTEEGVRNFWRWAHADGHSPVTDAEGRPKVVYHASDNKFKVFRPGELGMHFGNKDGEASSLGKPTGYYLRKHETRGMRDLGDWKPEDVMNSLPKREGHAEALSAVKSMHVEEPADGDHEGRLAHHEKVYAPVREYMSKHKLDHVTYANDCESCVGGRDNTSHIVLHPTQIKKAYGVAGHFSEKPGVEEAVKGSRAKALIVKINGTLKGNAHDRDEAVWNNALEYAQKKITPWGVTESPGRTYTKSDMLKAGADGHLSRATLQHIPLDKLDGLEPVPANDTPDGKYRPGRIVTQPIEVVHDKENDKYMVYSGNHRIAQARANGDSHIRAFVERIITTTEDHLPGGKGDNKKDSDFHPDEVEMGMKVELEHTKDPKIAREIVHDHLSENPRYYTKLKKAGLADELKEDKDQQLIDQVLADMPKEEASVHALVDKHKALEKEALAKGDRDTAFTHHIIHTRLPYEYHRGNAIHHINMHDVAAFKRVWPDGNEDIKVVHKDTKNRGKLRVTEFDKAYGGPVGHLENLDNASKAADEIGTDYKPVNFKDAMKGWKLRTNESLDAVEHPMIDVDGDLKHRHNSEGNPIHHSDEGIRNFHRWFGDSKITDEHGRPQVVYHSTTHDFTKFDPARSSGIAGHGVYVTRVKPENDNYGDRVMPMYAKISKPADFSSGDGAISDAAHKMKLPRMTDILGGLPELKTWTRKLTSGLKKAGHDGATLAGHGKNEVFHVAFNPEQVKSSIGNNGSFSSDSAHIHEATADATPADGAYYRVVTHAGATPPPYEKEGMPLHRDGKRQRVFNRVAARESVLSRIDAYLGEAIDPDITYTVHDIAGAVSSEDGAVTSAAKDFLRSQPHMGDWADSHDHFVVAHHPKHGVVGVAASRAHERDSVEVGYAVHPAFQRQGLASELLRRSEHANAEFGTTHFHADAVNPASAALLRKAGYSSADGRGFEKHTGD